MKAPRARRRGLVPVAEGQPMNQRHLWIALGVFVLILLLIFRGGMTPEEQIRARLIEMAEDFSRGRSGPCSEAFSDRYRDSSGIGKGDVRAMIAQASFSERDPETQLFLYRASLPVEEMQITVDADDPESAEVEMTALFEQKRGAEWRVVWKARVRAQLVEEDDGWQLVKSDHTTLEGRRFR